MTTFYFNSESPNIHIPLGRHLSAQLVNSGAFSRDIVIMCIGSDRSTGDSLGPIVGFRLSGMEAENVYIYGDIYNPINATNLGCSLRFIKEFHKNPYIIAIDACLGKSEHIGYVTLAPGPLHPGTGTENELPEVGDMHITGIVNTIHHGSHLLHSTRLCTVVTLARVIENGIRWAFSCPPR